MRGASGDLIGYLHLKDILYVPKERLEPVPAKRVRQLATVSATDEVEDVLRRCSGPVPISPGRHYADGVVRSVVFLEDVLEQLVGEVQDASQR